MGLGYRVFNAGEVLSAANINNYLMRQSVMTFASSGARGSALGTAVEEGMLSYLNDTNTLTVYDGSSWQQIYPQTSVNSITAAYTATASDANDTIYVSGTAAVTITVPDVLSIGERIDIWRNAGDTVTLAAGTGVSDWAGAGTAGTAITFKIDQTYNAATVQKVAANTYRVVGKVSV
jgi:hypothetical protein